MLQQKDPEDFVLATGQTFSVKDFIIHTFRHKGYNLWWRGSGEEEIGYDQNDIPRIKIDSKYYRPCEVDLLLGDPSKAKKKLGWERRFDTLDKLKRNQVRYLFSFLLLSSVIILLINQPDLGQAILLIISWM